MAFKMPTASREKVPGPPVGWRPRSLTLREKLEIVVRQSGKDPSGARLAPLGEGVQFDHVPAIQLRRWDPVACDTIPPSCDLRYIEARNRGAHTAKTAKSDVPAIAKLRRAENKDAKPKQKIFSRGFAKRRIKEE